jgi:hypothetical protein
MGQLFVFHKAGVICCFCFFFLVPVFFFQMDWVAVD